MRNLLITFAVFILFCSCDKGNPPFQNNPQLPAETQTGANTVGCILNGDVFLPHAAGINSEVNCFYQLQGGAYFFTMAFSDLRGGGVKTVSIQTQRIALIAGQTYMLNKNSKDDNDFTGGAGSYFPNVQNIYCTNTLKTGEIKITRIDLQKSIISGTFWFDGVNSSGEKVEVREGRFDWNY